MNPYISAPRNTELCIYISRVWDIVMAPLVLST